MAATGMQIKWDLTRFYTVWTSIKRRSENAASYYVRSVARMFIRRLAWHTPIAAYRVAGRTLTMRGRARAGWWPAAGALGVSSVYTPLPNLGEGAYVDSIQSRRAPSFTMINSVPYIQQIAGHGNWPARARADGEARAREWLEKSYRTHLAGHV